MKKKLICLLTAILMAAIAMCSLTGCNVQHTKKENTKIEADHIVDADVNLTVGVLTNQSENDVMQVWINAYQKKMNGKVSIEITKKYQAVTSLYEYMTSNTLPDICWASDATFANFAEAQHFQDLSNEELFPGSAEFFGGMYEAVVDTTHYNKATTNIGYVPRDYNRLAILYNKTVFENMGIECPQDGWTWEDFLSTCRKLKQNAGGGYQVTYPISWRNWAPVHTTILSNYGGSYINPQTGACSLGETGEAAWNFYDEFFGDALARNDEQGTLFSSYQNGSKNVQAAMRIDTYANLGTYLDAANKNGWVMEAVAFPSKTDADNGKGYTGYGCSGYAITKACSDNDKRLVAWDFLKWCMSEEGYNTVADLGVICPALKSMRNKGDWTKYGKDGTTVNYHAFVDESTEDADLGYEKYISDSELQVHMIRWVSEFWDNAGGGVEFEIAAKNVVDNFNQKIPSNKLILKNA